jgi:ABC-type dipeptide/oligopeptide/nickel transport system ATPase component
MQSEVVLKVEGLQTQFDTRRGLVRAVDGVDFELRRGEVLGIVGESGSGKSITAFSLMRALPGLSGRTVGGRVLNPLFTVGEQLEETIRFHAGSKAQGAGASARQRVLRLLAEVQLPSPEIQMRR